MVWGESNTRNFLNWADFCQSKAQQERGVRGGGGPDFASDRSSPQYNQVKEQLLDLIQKNRTVSVQQLYNTMPAELLQNSSVKNVILQLFFEDNIQVQGQGSTVTENETNYTLVFVKRTPTAKPRPVNNFTPQQSNIEDLIDNNWRATGRKLEFEKQEKPNRENLNISLRRSPRPTVNAAAVKPVVDIIKPIEKVETPKTPPVITTPKVEVPVEDKNITYIEIPKPSPVPEEITPSFSPDFKPVPVKELPPVVDQTIFYGLSAYELYFIGSFLSDAVYKESDRQTIKALKELVFAKADVIYIQNGGGIKTGVKIAGIILSIVIVGIIILAVKSKNKVKQKAIKSYNTKLKELGYEEMKTKLKAKYPKIIEF